MADRKNPELMTPAQETRARLPVHWITSTTKVLTTRYFSKIDSLSATLPGIYSKTTLATVLTIQKMEAKALACCQSATPALKAQVGIQPAQPTSSAMQRKNSRQMHISAFLGNLNSFFLCSCFSSLWCNSGEWRNAKGISAKNARIPSALIACSQKQITTAGPMSPPIPKNRFSSWIQKSWPAPMNSSNTHKLLRMFIMQHVAPAISIVTVKLRNPKFIELTISAHPQITIKYAKSR